MIDHGVHITAGNQKSKPWLSQHGNTSRVFPVRLGNDACRVAMGFQDPADNGMAKRRMIHIGIPDHIDKIKLFTACLFHFFSTDG